MIAAAKEHGLGWQLRVGVHLGPVIAGVMGKRSFVFDLWVDTVNVAARITAEAAPDTVVVSGTTWPLLGTGSRGSALGEFDLKAKGKIELVQYLGHKS